MIRYFLGRSGSGKTYAIYEEIAQYIEKRPEGEGLLIVPEQFSLQVERDLVNKMGGVGFSGFTVTSFRRLIEQVLRETGMPELMAIDDVGKAMLVKRLFLEEQKHLEVFMGIHEKPGFVALFSNFISELKQFGITAEALKNQANSEHEATNAKLRDSAKLYEALNRTAEGQFMDYEDLYIRMAEAVGKSEFLKGAHLWLDGFYFFNSLEQRILESMAMHCASVTVALTLDPHQSEDQEVFWAPMDALKTLTERMTECGVTQKKRLFSNHRDDRKKEALKHLEANMFKYPGQPYKGPAEGLSLVLCESPEWEVERAAQQILWQVKQRNLRWHDIAVVHHQSGTYDSLIKRIFEAYEIPYFMDERRSVMNSPLVRYVLGLLESVQKGYPHESVFKMLKTGMNGWQKHQWELLENRVLEKGIKGSRWKKSWITEALAEKIASEGVLTDKEHQLLELEALRIDVWQLLEGFETSLKACETVADYGQLLYQHLSDTGVESHVLSWLEVLREAGDMESLNEQTQVWNALVSVLDQMILVSGAQRCNGKSFTEMLETGLSLCDIGMIPAAWDRVLVGTLDRSKSHDIACLMILGFNDGVIPSLKDGSGILTDDEKIRLRESGLPLKSDGELMAKNELFSLYQLLCKPSSDLILHWSAQDLGGKPLRSSYWIDRIKKLYPQQEPLTFGSGLLPEPLWVHPRGSMKYLVKGLRDMVDERAIVDQWTDALSYYSSQALWQQSAQAIAHALFHKNQVSAMTSKVSKDLYGDPITSSVTRLETYRACPFSHFIKYGLKPEPNKVYEAALPDLGSLFHDAVERFAMESLFQTTTPLNELTLPQIEGALDRAVDRSLEHYKYEAFLSDHRSRYMLTKLRRTGKRAAKLLVEHLKKGEFEPFAFEVDFKSSGDNNRIPALAIELSDGTTILLEGRIDRIDVLDEGGKRYVKIIDYKSGSRAYDLSDVFNGLQIQLMVYMDAVLEQSKHFKTFKPGTSEAELHPAGLFYFKIDDPFIEGEDLSAEAIEQMIAKKLQLDGVVIGGLEMAQKMDVTLGEDIKKSDVIPFDIKADGTPAKSASYLEPDSFEALRTHVRGMVVHICEEMVHGGVRIQPYRCGNRTACDYCEYKGICQFDLQFEDNAYETVYKIDQETLKTKLLTGNERLPSGKEGDERG